MKKSLGARTFLFPMPVLLVGTYDTQDKPNLMTAAWGGICCSQPPCLTVSLRKATYSYECIMRRKAYTVGIPGQSRMAEADYCGIYSGSKENKFEQLGFTAVRSELVEAPYAAEIPVVLECRLLHSMDIGLHTQFIGEILNVLADESVLGEDRDKPDILKVLPLVYDHASSSYYGVGQRLDKAFSVGKSLKR